MQARTTRQRCWKDWMRLSSTPICSESNSIPVFAHLDKRRGDGHFSTTDKAKVASIFTKPNIRNMRKPHAASVHISPLLNLFDVNWQKAEVTEDDFIKVRDTHRARTSRLTFIRRRRELLEHMTMLYSTLSSASFGAPLYIFQTAPVPLLQSMPLSRTCPGMRLIR